MYRFHVYSWFYELTLDVLFYLVIISLKIRALVIVLAAGDAGSGFYVAKCNFVFGPIVTCDCAICWQHPVVMSAQ